MNYSKYANLDVVNGEGTRCTLFVSGCELNCKGCYNRNIMNPKAGHLFTKELEDQIIADLQDTVIPRRGLSLLGGDPLHPANLKGVLQLVKRVREECPDKDIWLWTGYTMMQLNEAQKEITEYVNVVVDGPYVEHLADPSLIWRGSSNQLVHQLR